MPSLQETKARITSITTTKKITKAMRLVATAKLTKAKKNLDSIQEYYLSVYETFSKLLKNVKDVSKIFPKPTTDSILHVAITSDLGLCGGYNSNILRQLKSSFKNKDKVILIGSKGVNNFKTLGLNIFKGYPHVGDDLNYDYAFEVAREVIALYSSGVVSSVKIHFTKFINSVTFEATELQLLPIVPDANKKEKNLNLIEFSGVTEFEPSADIVLKNSIPLYIGSMLYGAMAESKVSEHSSRRMAMENATDNADELIQKLGIQYNRARQASITQEISEIVAGAEAQ